MRLWIDGGSLHATLRCLHRNGSPNDAADLLHIAALLPFAERLVIGAYGGGQYVKQTEEARAKLVDDFNFDKTCIEVAHATSEQLDQIYTKAADGIAARLSDLLSKFTHGQQYDHLSPAQQELEKQFDIEIRKTLTTLERNDLYYDVKTKENNGLLIMLARSDKFYEEVRRLVGSGAGWSEHDTRRLASACRVAIHLESANQFDAVYTPSRDRGAALRNFRLDRLFQDRTIPEYVWHEIEEMFDEAIAGKTIQHFKSEGLKVGNTFYPPVAAALARRADGRPDALMRDVKKLRDKASPLRHYVARVLTTASTQDVKANDHVIADIEEMRADLAAYLHGKALRRLKRSALEFFSQIGLTWAVLGTPAVKPKQIGKLLAEIWAVDSARRFVVVSEMAGGLKVSGVNTKHLEALQRSVSNS